MSLKSPEVVRLFTVIVSLRCRRLLVAVGFVGLLLVCAAQSQSVAVGSARPATAPTCQPQSSFGSLLAGSNGVKLLSTTSIPLCATGSLTVVFHGSRAAGCARWGLCGFAGTETWSSQPAPSPYLGTLLSSTGELDVLTFSTHGHRSREANLFISGLGSFDANVTQAGSVRHCVDSNANSPSASAETASGRSLRIALSGRSSWIGTRCAGPLDSDLRDAFPSVQIPIARLLKGRQQVSFAMTRRFSSHGLTGLVISTVALTLGRATTGNAVPPPAHPRRPRARFRSVTVDYRVTAVTGSITVHVTAPRGAPGCLSPSACGTSALISVDPRLLRDYGSTFTAVGPARRPEADFLAAFGLSRTGNPRGIDVLADLGWRDAGRITVIPRGRSSCRDTIDTPSAGLLVTIFRRRVLFAYAPASRAYDPLRSHCPGPMLGSRYIAVGSVPTVALRHRTIVIALHHGIEFHDKAYRVSTTSTLTVTARRGIITNAP